jgi:hypothetical protein
MSHTFNSSQLHWLNSTINNFTVSLWIMAWVLPFPGLKFLSWPPFCPSQSMTFCCQYCLRCTGWLLRLLASIKKRVVFCYRYLFCGTDIARCTLQICNVFVANLARSLESRWPNSKEENYNSAYIIFQRTESRPVFPAHKNFVSKLDDTWFKVLRSCFILCRYICDQVFCNDCGFSFNHIFAHARTLAIGS